MMAARKKGKEGYLARLDAQLAAQRDAELQQRNPVDRERLIIEGEKVIREIGATLASLKNPVQFNALCAELREVISTYQRAR